MWTDIYQDCFTLTGDIKKNTYFIITVLAVEAGGEKKGEWKRKIF